MPRIYTGDHGLLLVIQELFQGSIHPCKIREICGQYFLNSFT